MNARTDLPPSGTASDDPARLRLDRLIEREIARLRLRYELSLDEFRGLFVSDEQVDALLQRGKPQVDLGPPPAAPMHATGSRWQQLRDALALDEDDLDLLFLAMAPELDAKYEVLFAYLHNDVTRKSPTMELALRLFARDDRHRLRLRGRLAPEAPLLRHGVLEFVTATREAPRPQRGLRLPSALADWLLGLDWQDERLVGIARRAQAPRPRSNSSTSLLAKLAQRGDSEAPAVVVSAPAAAEAEYTAIEALAAAGHDVIVIDMMALRAAAQPQEVVAALILMRAVLRCAFVATSLQSLLDAHDRPLDQACAALRRLARSTRPLVAAVVSGSPWRELLGDVRAVEVPLEDWGVSARVEAWRDLLAERAIALPDEALLALADRFALGPERIQSAVRHALDQVEAESAASLDAAHLHAAARAVSLEGSADVVRHVGPAYSWSDLILPAEVEQRLRDLINAVSLRPVVYDRWNFARPGGGQRGIKAMFAGPSGTGKTMAAAIVARELGLDLQRVELAAVMSKYIGETEKNLDRAFTAAQRANAVLFIDEADALLGKRSEVKDAHDRYANVEVAFLLQRMEDHGGIVIVATNLAHNIDAAFARRMQFVVQFPQPDIGGRERLWQAMLPGAAPRADDLDIGFLARQFGFSGGDIRTIALEAAFRSAHQGSAIGMREVLGAVVAHYAKLGKLPSANEFGQYALLLDGIRDTSALGDPPPVNRVRP